MATDLIRYDVLVQQALRSVVRKVLSDGARDGLPGAHHFYISFDTKAAGVKIAPRLHETYPEEMTIVLQHQYWDLAVHDSHFEVSLSFDKIPERLVIPYDAITGFFDPSVKFGLKFESVANEPAAEPEEKPARSRKKPKVEESAEPVPLARKPKPAKDADGAPAPAPAAEAAPAQGTGPAEPAKDGASAEVVSLDAFRKKK